MVRIQCIFRIIASNTASLVAPHNRRCAHKQVTSICPHLMWHVAGRHNDCCCQTEVKQSKLFVLQGEKLLPKPGKGAFYNTDIDEYLRAHSISHLLITGVTTEVTERVLVAVLSHPLLTSHDCLPDRLAQQHCLCHSFSYRCNAIPIQTSALLLHFARRRCCLHSKSTAKACWLITVALQSDHVIGVVKRTLRALPITARPTKQSDS